MYQIIINEVQANDRRYLRGLMAAFKGYSWGEGRRFRGIRPCNGRYAEALQRRCLRLLRRRDLAFAGESHIAELYAPENEEGLSHWCGNILLVVPEKCVAPQKPAAPSHERWEPDYDLLGTNWLHED